MNYLLDTHAFIWLDGNATKLSPKIQQVIANRTNSLFLSLVSIWEIQIKYQVGKLQLRLPLAEVIADQTQNNQIQILPITLTHILEIEKLPFYHNDPFDRLLIAQARTEGFTLVTEDAQIIKYAVTTLW